MYVILALRSTGGVVFLSFHAGCVFLPRQPVFLLFCSWLVICVTVCFVSLAFSLVKASAVLVTLLCPSLLFPARYDCVVLQDISRGSLP